MAKGHIRKKLLATGDCRWESFLYLGRGQYKTRTFRRKRDAQEWLNANSVRVQEGTYARIKRATFDQYVEHWDYTHLLPTTYKPSTRNAYGYLIATHLLPAFGNYRMTAIQSADINEFRARLLRGGLSSGTVANILSLLGRIFKDAIADSYLRHSPMAGVKKPKMGRKRSGRALKPHEIKAVLNQLPEPEARLVFLTAVLTGLRRGEIFGLFWTDLDWKIDVIRVERSVYWKYGKHLEKSENGKPNFELTTPKSEYSIRKIDLSPQLTKELREFQLATGNWTGLVFRTDKRTPYDPGTFIKRKISPAFKAAGLDNVRFHDLRHTYGSLKLDQGENIYYIQRQMGHSSIQVTIDIYGHLLEERKPEAAARTDSVIFADQS